MLKHRFDYHKPDKQKAERHERVRKACHLAAVEVVSLTDPSWEQTLALNKLEEAMFWANAAIAREIETSNR